MVERPIEDHTFAGVKESMRNLDMQHWTQCLARLHQNGQASFARESSCLCVLLVVPMQQPARGVYVDHAVSKINLWIKL